MKEAVGVSEGLLQGVQNRLREAIKGDSDFDADFFFERIVKLLAGNANSQYLFDVLSWMYLGLEVGHKILSRVLPEDKYLEVCGRGVNPEQIAEIVGGIKTSMADCHPYCEKVEDCLPGQVDRAYRAMGEEEREGFLQLLAEMAAEISKLSMALPGTPIIVAKKGSANLDPAGEEEDRDPN